MWIFCKSSSRKLWYNSSLRSNIQALGFSPHNPAVPISYRPQERSNLWHKSQSKGKLSCCRNPNIFSTQHHRNSETLLLCFLTVFIIYINGKKVVISLTFPWSFVLSTITKCYKLGGLWITKINVLQFSRCEYPRWKLQVWCLLRPLFLVQGWCLFSSSWQHQRSKELPCVYLITPLLSFL